jgi:hypothetical protein
LQSGSVVLRVDRLGFGGHVRNLNDLGGNKLGLLEQRRRRRRLSG